MVSGLSLAGCTKKDTGPGQSNGNTSSQPTAPADYVVNQGELVFFWGEGCPHCENVEKFLRENPGLEEKVKLKKIEVFKDLSGQKLFLEKVKECGLESAGVPVLYQGGKCVQGDQPIIEELKKNL